jgi:hypothetical protein
MNGVQSQEDFDFYKGKMAGWLVGWGVYVLNCDCGCGCGCRYIRILYMADAAPLMSCCDRRVETSKALMCRVAVADRFL